MRRNLARIRDTLTWGSFSGQKEVQRLKESAQETELNYRTKPLSDEEERALALRRLVCLSLQCFLLGFMYQVLRVTGYSLGQLLVARCSGLLCVYRLLLLAVS